MRQIRAIVSLTNAALQHRHCRPEAGAL